MSYLLDALKQSKHETMSAEQYDLQAQQLKQQRQLLTYRRISFLLAGSLVAVGILVSGFFVGKWLQQENAAINNSHTQNEIPQTTLVQKKPEMLKETPSSEEKATETVSSAEVTSPELSQTAVPNSTPTIAGQLVYVQTPTGVQQMLLTPQGQYLSMSTAQSPQMQTQNYSTQNNVSPSFQPSNQPQSVQTQTAKRTLSADELSKYKVLGKPLNQTVPEQRPSSPSELDAVPDTLKNAFAQAVNNTEKAADYEVTQGSRLSSRVQPVELLPDGLQSMLPSIKYQAHIYSSTADKRWIKLNGRELYEGESIGALKVLEIAPDQSVLDFDGYEFSLKALQDWPQ